MTYPYNNILKHRNSIFDQNPEYPGALYFGKYRGIVTNNQDPENEGKIKATVPLVYGDSESDWMMPCLPFANGMNVQITDPDPTYKATLTLTNLDPTKWIPALGDAVWVEFEAGNPDYPIWVGGWIFNNKV